VNGFLALVGFVTLLFLAVLGLAALALWLLRDNDPGVIDITDRIESSRGHVKVVERPAPADPDTDAGHSTVGHVLGGALVLAVVVALLALCGAVETGWTS